MRTKTKKGLVDFKRKRSLGSVVPLLFLATGFNVVSANGVETFFNTNYENDRVSVVVQTITGTVVDADGIPLPGATVVIKGTSKGTQSDFDGNFTIDANAGDVLEISYVGFKTQEIVVDDQASLNVTLEQDIDALDEVVVIGYGSQRKSDVTGAVARVTEKQYKEQPITRTEEILQGRTAGVSLARTNGSAGAGVKIRVRGVNSIGSENGPLVVVDGFIGGDLRTINPSDIKSIEVLKDASALAIYGSRGANGVILVSTKKGKGKPQVNFEQFVSVSQLAKKYEGRLTSGEFARVARDRGRGGFTDEDISFLDANPIDYEDELFRTAFTRNSQLSVNGGSDKFNYFVSGNLTDQEGIVITNEYERISLRSNLSSKVNDKLTVGLNLYGSRENETNNPNDFDDVRGGISARALAFDPTTPLRNEEGEFNRTSQRGLVVPIAVNPIVALLGTNDEREVDRFDSNLNVKYDFNDNFSYTLLAGGRTLNEIREQIRDDSNRRAELRSRRFTEHQVSNILNWNQSFGNHNFDVTGVYEFTGSEERIHEYLIDSAEGETIFLADNGSRALESVTNEGNERSIESYLGRINYNFNNSLYITGSLRRDESSIFAKGERVGYFPAAALSYSFNNLSFIENSNVFSSLKLRTSWGLVGNQSIDVNAIRSFDTQEDRNGFSFEGDITNLQPGSEPNRVANTGLTWETTETINGGIDLGLFNNKVNLSFDYFEKTTNDLLLSVANVLTGVTRFQNVAEIENKGFDISLSAGVFDTDNFSWDVFATISHIKNEVTKITDEQNFIPGEQESLTGSEEGINRVVEGEALGSFVGQRYLGVYNEQEPLLDAEGNIVANFGDQLFESSASDIIGNGTPEWTWGFNNTFRYKKIDLNVFIQGSAGFQVYNQARAILNGLDGPFQDNLLTTALNVTTPERLTDVPTSNSFDSSRYVEDGDFVRLANLSLGYTLDNPMKGISSLNVYVSGQNLFLITDYSGYDPEGSSAGLDDRRSGIDLGGVPNPRTYTMGVKVSF